MKRLMPCVALLLTLVPLVAVFGCSGQDAKPLDVRAPWADGERTFYIIQNRKGEQIGSGEMEAIKDGDAYVLRQLYLLPGGTTDDIAIRVRSYDLKPLSGHREITSSKGLITINTTYRDSKLSIQANTPERGKQSAEIDVPADAYDNEQALFLWRALPLGEGLSVSYTNVVSANALKPRITVRVVGQERVSVPAGEFATWKMEMEAGQQKQHLWYAVEAPHYLVKYDNGTTIFLLEKHP